VLLTRGRQPLRTTATPAGESPSAWCVQVLHFARPEMTFWFNDARELLHADLGSGLITDTASAEQIARFKAARERN
jgi:hypothetical protein